MHYRTLLIAQFSLFTHANQLGDSTGQTVPYRTATQTTLFSRIEKLLVIQKSERKSIRSKAKETLLLKENSTNNKLLSQKLLNKQLKCK